MRPRRPQSEDPQGELFKAELVRLCAPAHPLVKLAQSINWASFDAAFSPQYHPSTGRPALPTRLMVGLHYLKHVHDVSDEVAVATWCENPYWQYFCGGRFFEHELPFDPSSMTKWRQKVAAAGAQKLLEETIAAGLRLKAIKPAQLTRVNVDTTVQPKAVRFPTDARLLDRARERLVAEAERAGLTLERTFRFVSRRALRRQSGYVRAQQFRRARREVRRLRTYLRRVIRQVERTRPQAEGRLGALLQIARRILLQQRTDKGKVYSVHAPEVECLAKGKPQRPYEFGCKVSVATTARGHWVVGAKACPGNPYDGHTLAGAMAQVETLTGVIPDQVAVDLGYRGHDYRGPATVLIVNRFRQTVPERIRRWWRCRSAIEPVIGHLKASRRLERNRLKGVLGDQLNVLFAAAAQNLAKLLRYAAAFLRALLTALYQLLKPHAFSTANA
jgi:transposase, IS5 family